MLQITSIDATGGVREHLTLATKNLNANSSKSEDKTAGGKIEYRGADKAVSEL